VKHAPIPLLKENHRKMAKYKRTYYYVKACLGTYISTNKRWFLKGFGFVDSDLKRIRAFSEIEARKMVRKLSKGL
jgi:hypothetical protein